MDLKWVGGTGWGDTAGQSFIYPDGTNPNNTNVSFEIIPDRSATGDTFYTADGTITGNRTVSFSGTNLLFTGSSPNNLDSFGIYTNEFYLPLAPEGSLTSDNKMMMFSDTALTHQVVYRTISNFSSGS